MKKIIGILRNETGSALFIALGAILILTVLSIGVMAIAQYDIKASGRTKKSTQALHVAEAGIDKALWELKQLGTVSSSFEVTTSLGTATVSSTQDAQEQYLWTITSTGEASGGVERIIKVKVFNLSYWNMIMAAESLTAGGGGLNGTTSIDGPFYVRGNLDLGGGAELTGGPLFVKDGIMDLTTSACAVGTESEPIPLYLEQGMTGHIDVVHYSSLSYDTPNISLPDFGQADMQDLLYEARDQSIDNNKGYAEVAADESISDSRKYSGVSSGYYKVVDNNTEVTSPLGTGVHSLTIDSSTPSFGDPGTEASPEDDFAWDLSTKTLTIRGTVYVDGPVTVSTDIEYQGNGAIIANGDITIENDIEAADTFPASSCLGLISPGTIYIDNPTSNSSLTPNLEAAIFGLQAVIIQKTICIKGSILTQNLEFAHPNGHLLTATDLPGYLPEAMPGSTENLTLVTGWHEGKP